LAVKCAVVNKPLFRRELGVRDAATKFTTRGRVVQRMTCTATGCAGLNDPDYYSRLCLSMSSDTGSTVQVVLFCC
jgi:hypothetical protein